MKGPYEVPVEAMNLEGAMERVNEARASVFQAREDLEEANRELVKSIVARGWEDCLAPKLSTIRRRLRS